MKRLLVIAALSILASTAAAQTPTFTFGVSGTSQDGKTIRPTISWATSPAATSCTASATPAKSDWTGTKTAQAPAGGSLLTAVSATTSFQLVCNWPGDQVGVVTWVPPTTNTDGTPLTDLAGFRVQWGRASGDVNMDQTVYLSEPARTTWTSPALSPAGPWFFGVKAFNSLGLESTLSNVVSKTITLTNSITRSMDIVIRFPAAPTNLAVQ